MEREFLENFKVGDTPLPKEVVDAILEENGRDIEAAKQPFADYDSIKEQLQTARDGLKAFEGVDVKDLQGQVAQLTQAGLEFDGALKDAITAARGRSVKAVRAMLDVEALRSSKNRDADIKSALENLRKDSGCLFEPAEVPPPFAAGTGTGGSGGTASGLDAIRAAAGLTT